MKTPLFSFILVLVSPVIFTLFLTATNCLPISLIFTLIILSLFLIGYAKKSKNDRKTVFFSLILFLILFYPVSYLHLHTFLDKAAFSLPWGSVFWSARFSHEKSMGIYSSKWNFEEPGCYFSEYSLKLSGSENPIVMNIFIFYSRTNVRSYFNDYVEKLKSKGFSTSKVNLSPAEVSKVRIIDYIVLENETKIVYCELLEKEDKTAILVIVADKKDVELVKKLIV